VDPFAALTITIHALEAIAIAVVILLLLLIRLWRRI
jgi:hypothetical protein